LAPPPQTREGLRLAIRSTIVLVVVLALVLVETSSRSGVSWRLITFTYQANIFAAAYYAWTLCSPNAGARSGRRGAVVLYVVAAGVVWNLFLTGHSMGYTPANFLLHVAVPTLAVADWLLIGRGQNPVRWWQPIVWLSYPAAYGVLAFLVLNNAGRRAPYYFLDPGSVGAGIVTMNVALLAAGFLVLGYLLAGLARATSANA
jgi:hypothetical protein